jgi:hypothetical protein
MELMSNPNNYESLLWKLLEAEKLADLSQFHQRGFFEEVPLYSRESDLDFLPASKDAASAILLKFALKFLKSIVAYEEHRTGYFAAITLWSLSPAPLVPHLFVWCGPVRPLQQKLALNPPTTPFVNQIRKRVGRLRLGEAFEVFEDTSTIVGATRAFIAPARAPYAGFAILEAFRRPARASARGRLRA